MITNCSTVEAAVHKIYGESVTIDYRKGAFGGCINDTCQLSLSNQETVFLKTNSSALTGMFMAEAAGLLALNQKEGPKVPLPLACHEGNHTQFLLLSYIPSGRPHKQHYQNFGHMLAGLHQKQLSTTFGFDGDNYIGSTPQKNGRFDEWIPFFRDQRLGFQIRLAAKNGASKELVQKVEKLMEVLDRFLVTPPHPSILHGDLWSGNAMVDEDGDAVIFDPAAYFGHYEAELAMTELFGRFPSEFYDAYNEVLPLDSEYRKVRKTIYNLYHILNHLNIFGPSYEGQALSMVRRFV